VDQYHLACIFILNLEIGYLTPPFGMNLFISTVRFNKPFLYVVRTILPFIGVLLVALVIVTYVPIFSTWLPSKVRVDEADQSFVMPEVGSDNVDTSQPLEEEVGASNDALDKLAGEGEVEDGGVVEKADGGADGGEPDAAEARTRDAGEAVSP
jgi:hypothetical protein